MVKCQNGMANDNRIPPEESPLGKEPALDLKARPQKLEATSVVPETIEGGEGAHEEQVEGAMTETAPQEEGMPTQMPTPAPISGAGAVPQRTDRLSEEIDDILEEDLADLYRAMSADQKRKFRVKGEETVSKIRELLRATKENAKKIFHLFREWLKLIPGVNRFFLEQEAKIKTDKILVVSEEERARSQKESL